MTHYQLTLFDVTFSFRPVEVMLAAAAFVTGVVILFAYVSALQTSIERGQALREIQRTGTTADNRASSSHKLVALTP
jgi:hypothetical protein